MLRDVVRDTAIHTNFYEFLSCLEQFKLEYYIYKGFLTFLSMVRHIPPTIKQLLTLRNPNAFVGPSISSLDHLFDKTYTNARMQGAGTGWLVLTVHPYDFPVYCHLPKCRPDLYVVDSKHSFVCRPSLSLRDPFRDERSELCAQSSPHARSRTEEHHLCRRSSCKATHLSPSVTLNPFFFRTILRPSELSQRSPMSSTTT